MQIISTKVYYRHAVRTLAHTRPRVACRPPLVNVNPQVGLAVRHSVRCVVWYIDQLHGSRMTTIGVADSLH